MSDEVSREFWGRAGATSVITAVGLTMPLGWLPGILAFAYQGVIWVTTKENVARIGPIEIQRERDVPIPIAPIVGGVALAAGVILLATRRGAAA